MRTCAWSRVKALPAAVRVATAAQRRVAVGGASVAPRATLALSTPYSPSIPTPLYTTRRLFSSSGSSPEEPDKKDDDGDLGGFRTRHERDAFEEDQALQDRFYSFFGFLSVMVDELKSDLEGNAMTKFVTKLDRHAVCEQYSGLALRLFYQNVNPLLLKYQFDLFDFAVGVKDAFLVAKEAASVTLDAAIYPENYTTPEKIHELNEQRAVVHDCFSDNMQRYLKVAAKEQELFRQMNIKLETAAMSKLEVLRREIHDLRTRIVYPDPAALHQEAKGGVIELTEQVDPAAAGGRKRRRSADERQRDEDLRRYRPGAVIARVDVYFEAAPIASDSAGAKKDGSKTLPVAEVWVFEGCISGHVPLSWIVTESYSVPALRR